MFSIVCSGADERSLFIALNEKTYELSEVFAEPDSVASTSVLAGGIVGLFGGVLGVIAGSVAGGIIGTQVEKNEKDIADKFNKSGLIEWIKK